MSYLICSQQIATDVEHISGHYSDIDYSSNKTVEWPKKNRAILGVGYRYTAEYE